MAYVLGFFAADGCMIKNNRGAHFIEFQITDKDILLKIKKLLGSNHKITERKNNIKWKMAYRLQIGSKKMFEDLIALGMTSRKSNTLKLPIIPKKYFNHFVRGYFDGDGNVYIHKRKDRKGKLSLLAGFTCGSEVFLEKIFSELKKTANIKKGSLYCKNNIYYCLYFSTNDSVSLYNFMYNQCGDLFLLRKRERFEKYLKNR